MQTPTFMTKTYFNILIYLKLARLFTFVSSFEGKSTPLHFFFSTLGPMITDVYNMDDAVYVDTLAQQYVISSLPPHHQSEVRAAEKWD